VIDLKRLDFCHRSPALWVYWYRFPFITTTRGDDGSPADRGTLFDARGVAPVNHPGRRKTRRRQSEVSGRPTFGPHTPAGPADPRAAGGLATAWAACHHISKGRAARLGELERPTRWRSAIAEIGRPQLRVHDLRHNYASLARRAGADLRLLQKTIWPDGFAEPGIAVRPSRV
jgi:hypothetical protein